MHTTLIFFLASLFAGIYVPVDVAEEEGAIFQAVFTHRQIEKAIIRVPRYESQPTQLVLLQNQFTANVEQVQLHSAELVVLSSEEVSQQMVHRYYVIDSFQKSGNTASLSFGQWENTRAGVEEGTYGATVSLARKKGRWVATHVKERE